MKRLAIAAVGLALVVGIFATACGGGDEVAAPGGQTPGASPAGGTVTIDVWHGEPAANVDTLERLVSRYNSSQDEVKVRPSFQGTSEEITAKLLTSLNSGQAPRYRPSGRRRTLRR